MTPNKEDQEKPGKQKEIPKLPEELPARPEQPEIEPIPEEKPSTPERPEVTPGKEPLTPLKPNEPAEQP